MSAAETRNGCEGPQPKRRSHRGQKYAEEDEADRWPTYLGVTHAPREQDVGKRSHEEWLWRRESFDEAPLCDDGLSRPESLAGNGCRYTHASDERDPCDQLRSCGC